MISKTKIKSRIKRKTKSELAETIRLATKNESWIKLAAILSGPTRQYSSVNLEEIEKQTTVGDTVIIPGKVLSKGEITKKVRICALSFSQTALDKLKKTKSEAVSILEEIKKNLKASGVKLIK